MVGFSTENQDLNSPDYPNSDALTQRFNAALKRIKDNGVYDAIVDKYGIDRSL